MRDDVLSWNRIPRVSHACVLDLSDRHADFLPPDATLSCLPYGNGRSYGDVCLNPSGALLRTRGLDHFIAFDRQTGRLTCESGLLLSDILALTVPQGWFVPVTPGTQFATIGGCVANDVHGKNHHDAGSFGCSVVALTLRRSDGQDISCSREENAEWFAATVGGLGLTGLITTVTLDLKPIANPFMVTQATRFSSIDEFWSLNADMERLWPYTVAWLDCTHDRGRGILYAGRHAPPQSELPAWKTTKRHFPFDMPFSCVNSLSLRAFNETYYRRPLPSGLSLTHYVPYFYPLDAIRNWNRLYGRKGFYQYQCVLPTGSDRSAMSAILHEIAASGTGSFLSVLKTFGTRRSPGMLSFPRPGATLALDFPNLGQVTEKLLTRLDHIVVEAGGALYPAKDGGRMSSTLFRRGFPAWERFQSFIDPRFSSGFWQRVGAA